MAPMLQYGKSIFLASRFTVALKSCVVDSLSALLVTFQL